MDFTSPFLIWFIAGIALFFLELFVPAFVLFFFGVGAWLTALVCWLTPVGINGQLLIFIASSLVALFTLRRLITRVFRGNAKGDEGDSAFARPGSHGEVVTAIHPPAEGRIKYAGSSWRAVADEEIAIGEIVAIVSQQGLLMKVSRVDESAKPNVTHQ